MTVRRLPKSAVFLVLYTVWFSVVLDLIFNSKDKN